MKYLPVLIKLINSKRLITVYKIEQVRVFSEKFLRIFTVEYGILTIEGKNWTRLDPWLYIEQGVYFDTIKLKDLKKIL